MNEAHNRPIERAPGLWTIDHPLLLGGIPMGTRTTLVRLNSGGLVIHSPGPLAEGRDEGGREVIEQLGSVAAIVAPNLFHHFYVEENVKAWPEAELFLAAGLAKKQPNLPAGETLTAETPELWRGEIEQLVVEGMPVMGEVVFFHPASRTLLLTDLCFNMPALPGLLPGLMLRMMGAWDRFGPSRLARFFIKDKPAVRRAVDRILEWDFDRITVTHGGVVESGGRAVFERVWRETLPG